MNQRIRELLKQAEERYPRHLAVAVPEVVVRQDALEKFAELIVQECMSQIEEVRQIKIGNAGPIYTQGFEDGMFVAIRTIEEHFGVEE